MALRVYIIGAGVIARRHAEAVLRLPADYGAELHAGARRPEALARFEREFPGVRTHADIHAMLRAPAAEDDIVVVATPPSAHRDLTCEALSSGRHTLCEKPLALDEREAGEMLETARSHDRLLGCCSTRFLGTPPMEEAKRHLAQGKLGRIYHASFVNRRQRNRAGIDDDPDLAWFRDPAASGGGVLMDMAPYDFATLNDLLRPVRVDVLSAWLAKPIAGSHVPGAEECELEQHAGASMTYHTPAGEVVAVSYERAGCTHGPPRVIAEVEGTLGAVAWDWFELHEGMASVAYTHDRDGKPESLRTSYRGDSGLSYGDKPVRYFADRVMGGDSPAVVNEQAVLNFLCVRALYECAASGRPKTVRLGGVRIEDR
jgi:predicted dehydrogenase